MHYLAFISYSHRDHKWAAWLHRKLENYKIDNDLRLKSTLSLEFKTSLRPIFRDRDDFSGGQILSEAAKTALQSSDYLIVICSQNSASSRYVNEEIKTFKLLSTKKTIIPLIIDGEPGDKNLECFPEALKFDFLPSGQLVRTDKEIIAADARKHADGIDLAFHKVVAGLLQVPLDEVRKRASRAQRKKILLLSSAFIIMFFLAVVACYAAWIAQQKSILAEKRLDLALETAGSITNKVSKFKYQFGVPSPVLKDFLLDVELLLNKISLDSTLSENLIFRQGKLYEYLSFSNKNLGDTGKALEYAQEAVQKIQYIVDRFNKSDNMQNELCWRYIELGDIIRQRGDLKNSEIKYNNAKIIISNLISANNSNMQWKDTYAAVYGRIIDNFLDEGNSPQAKIEVDKLVDIRRQIFAYNPKNPGNIHSLSLALKKRANIHQSTDSVNEAYKSSLEAVNLMIPLVKQIPENNNYSDTLAMAKLELGSLTERMGKMDEAIKLYEEAYPMLEKISNSDNNNVNKLDSVAYALNYLSYAYQRTSNIKKAIELYNKQNEYRKKIIKLDQKDISQKNKLSISLAMTAYGYTQLGDIESAYLLIEEALKIGEDVSKINNGDVLYKKVRVVHLGMMVNIAGAKGDKEKSTSALKEMISLNAELRKKEPDNGNLLRGLVVSSNMLIAEYRKDYKLTEAKNLIEETKKLVQPYLVQFQSDVGWLYLLSSIFEQEYMIQWDLNDFDAAFDAASKSLHYAREWAKVDTFNIEAKKSLSEAVTIYGISLRKVKNFSAAIISLEEGISIRKEIYLLDPNNIFYGSSLAVSYMRLSDVYMDQNLLKETLEQLSKCKEVYRPLLAIAPLNMVLKKDASVCFEDNARLLIQIGEDNSARQDYEFSLNLKREMIEYNSENKSWMEDYDRLKNQYLNKYNK